VTKWIMNKLFSGLVVFDQLSYEFKREDTNFGTYWTCTMVLKVGDGYSAQATSRHKNQAFAYCLRDVANWVMADKNVFKNTSDSV